MLTPLKKKGGSRFSNCLKYFTDGASPGFISEMAADNLSCGNGRRRDIIHAVRGEDTKKTVWQMLHCIKNAYAEANEKLGNVVGMEETCTNSSEINRHTSKQKKMRDIMGVILLLKWSLIQDGETRCS